MFSMKKNLKSKGQIQGLGWFFDMISVKAHWEQWYRCNCDLRVINAWKKVIFCCIEWVAEMHRNMCTCAYYVTLGSTVAAWVKKMKKRGPERPAYSHISSNPSGRILLKGNQNILPAAKMPELTIQTGECWHQSYSAFCRNVLFFDSKCIVIVVFLLLLLHQTDPWQNLWHNLEWYLSVHHDWNITHDWTVICLSTSSNT